MTNSLETPEEIKESMSNGFDMFKWDRSSDDLFRKGQGKFLVLKNIQKKIFESLKAPALALNTRGLYGLDLIVKG